MPKIISRRLTSENEVATVEVVDRGVFDDDLAAVIVDHNPAALLLDVKISEGGRHCSA